MAFEGTRGIPFSDFTDGTSKTIVFAEVLPGRATVWTKPADLEVDTESAVSALIDVDSKGFNVMVGDGSIGQISSSIPPIALRMMMTRNQGL